ncbi:MAG TPA: hypothetical protein DCZ92_08295 [Elusimicrobia bacterium]|nr:MAG: hypothetical protein A2016_09745 [Elusimicrobia bacterium GWF2_62_30]HBA60804.1 hypothetical protein [Elusimicrobiota bacterium]
MRFLFLAFLLAAAVVPAPAQVYLGAELGPDSFMHGGEAAVDGLSEEAFAWAVTVEVSSSVLYSVFRSSSPEAEIFKYLRHGIYRQELAALLLLSREKDVPFSKLAAELPKAGGLRGLSKKYGADAADLFARGGRLKEAADLRVPLFLSVSTSPAQAEFFSPGISTGAVGGAGQ